MISRILKVLNEGDFLIHHVTTSDAKFDAHFCDRDLWGPINEELIVTYGEGLVPRVDLPRGTIMYVDSLFGQPMALTAEGLAKEADVDRLIRDWYERCRCAARTVDSVVAFIRKVFVKSLRAPKKILVVSTFMGRNMDLITDPNVLCIYVGSRGLSSLTQIIPKLAYPGELQAMLYTNGRYLHIHKKGFNGRKIRHWWGSDYSTNNALNAEEHGDCVICYEPAEIDGGTRVCFQCGSRVCKECHSELDLCTWRVPCPICRRDMDWDYVTV